MVQSYGSVARPVSLDYFQRIIEVGWPRGGLVVLEVEILQGVSGFFFEVLSPDDVFVGSRFLTTITPTDYRDDENWFAERVGEPFVIEEHIVTQDEINDIWIWDAFLINELGDDTGVEEGVRQFGQFDLHFEGMQVAHDTQHFGRPLLGDYVEYVHPNGHRVTYAHGATPLSQAYIQWQAPASSGGTLYTGVVIRPSDPNGVPPVQDLSNTESWYWYHLGSSPGAEVNRVRQSYLINFASERTISAAINNFANVLPDNTVKYTLRGYPDGTSFTVADGRITPDPPETAATWEETGTVPSSFDGIIKRFGATGATG